MGRLDGRTAIVNGGATGIGATVLQFVKEGARTAVSRTVPATV